MLEELLKIIYEAEGFIFKSRAIYHAEVTQLLNEGAQEMEELDTKIHRHFKEYSNL